MQLSQFPIITNPPVSRRIRPNPEKRVGIGLGKAVTQYENSLILLVIQRFCETIFTDGFTMVC